MPYKRSGGKKWVGTFQVRGERVWIGTYSTKKEAIAAEGRKRREKLGLSPETFEGWAERWLADYARPASSTQKTYRYAVDKLVAEFGSRPLSSIERLEARQVANKLAQQPLKIARAMFNDAIDAGIVNINPFANLRLEQPRGRKDIDALTEAEIISLADASLKAFGEDTFSTTMRAWVIVAGFTGIRPAESFTLEWHHIEGDTLLIEGTKTQTARRKIILPPIARNALLEMSRRFESPYVFVSKTGRGFRKGILHRNFDKVRTAWGRPDFNPYELRHACATNLMRRGVEPWAIAQQLGHADHGKLVMDTYGHPSERDAQERIKRAYSSPFAADLQQAPSE